MVKRGLPGQLNLFDFWGDTNSEDSIVEMVSLVPQEQEVEMVSLIPDEPELKRAAPEKQEDAVSENSMTEEAAEETVNEEAEEVFVKGQTPVMHKETKGKDGSVLAEISYLNYNKVYIKNKEYRQGKLFEFENSKEAVDFYISEMTKLTGEEEWEQE